MANAPFKGLGDPAPTMSWVHNPPVSQAQARLFGAVAGGKSTEAKGMTVAQGKEALRGAHIKNLPERK